ncbi:50S ribosomal protein L32, partial [Salibacterium salarium]
MAVPKRRTSKTRKKERRTHHKISVPGMVKCPDCGDMKLSHRIC